MPLLNDITIHQTDFVRPTLHSVTYTEPLIITVGPIHCWFSNAVSLYPHNTILSFWRCIGIQSHFLKWPVTKHVSLWKVVCCFSKTSHLRGETPCSHSRFHQPRQLVITASLCSNWARMPVDLHLSAKADKAGTSARPWPFLSSPLPPAWQFLRMALPCLILSAMSATTWPTWEPAMESKSFLPWQEGNDEADLL